MSTERPALDAKAKKMAGCRGAVLPSEKIGGSVKAIEKYSYTMRFSPSHSSRCFLILSIVRDIQRPSIRNRSTPLNEE